MDEATKQNLKELYPYLQVAVDAYDHVTCGKNIRAELKHNFPNVKFSVRYSHYSGGNDYYVTWTDGPTLPQVGKIIKKYAYGKFDGMTDSAWNEPTSFNSLFGGVKYANGSRKISNEGRQKIKDDIFPDLTEENSASYDFSSKGENISQYVSRYGVENLKIEEILNVAAADYDFTDYSTMKKVEVKKEIDISDISDGDFGIIDYSEKSFVVVGNTKPIKDKLKEMGGRFNNKLSCGCGWVFPIAKEDEVLDFLSSCF